VPNRRTLRLLTAAVPLMWFAVACNELQLSQQSTETDLFDDLYSVAVIDAQHVIAVGDHGSIYRTEDGGQRWQKAESSTSRSLYSVSMADTAVGWVVGQYGTILKTVDAGRSWAVQPGLEEKRNLHLFGVHAVDAETAWGVGVWGTRILTRDGGCLRGCGAQRRLLSSSTQRVVLDRRGVRNDFPLGGSRQDVDPRDHRHE